MCIRQHVHRMLCDVRPFAAVARQTFQGRMVTRVVNPYADPTNCRHDCLIFRGNCPWNGCCELQTIDLPCDCAGHFPWGKDEATEDIQKCRHFREFHEYVFSSRALLRPSRESLRSPVDTRQMAEGWNHGNPVPYLDGWVTMKLDPDEPDTQPNLYCEVRNWAKTRREFAERCTVFYAEFVKVEAEIRLLNSGWPESEERRQERGERIGKLWREVHCMQKLMWTQDRVRAKALIGFAESDEEAPVRHADAGGVPGRFI
ncbi:hypothetical protein B0T17DRAFT_511707 [Bombardia bombarda]|uniref:Uncharacterized protein n=1 Tax=Bombardia bombarda TaxID=252184 RepID=A0AA39WD11_9PEZI|nr:hypothetical protein B0T17DRAFT_511707 [Bombardia bombarda]